MTGEVVEQDGAAPGLEGSALVALFDEHAADLHRELVGRFGRGDLVAETFLVAYERREQFDPGREGAGAWLGGIATMLAAEGPDAPHAASESVEPEVLAQARSLLLSAIAEDVPRAPDRRWQRYTVAGLVVLLVAIGVTAWLRQPSATRDTMTAAAAAVGVTDPPAQDKWHIVVTDQAEMHDLGAPNGEQLSYIGEVRTEVWVPVDAAHVWLVDQRAAERHWMQGSEQAAARANLTFRPLDDPDHTRTYACGVAYDPNLIDAAGTPVAYPSTEIDDAGRPCPPGGWQLPTEAFVAALPRDPQRLLDILRAGGPTDLAVLVRAADVLRCGLAPADLRAALYLAVGELHSLTVTPGVVTLDSRSGTALGVDASTGRQEIVVDVATGDFIGVRRFVRDPGTGAPTDESRLTYSVVRAAVVDESGQPG